MNFVEACVKARETNFKYENKWINICSYGGDDLQFQIRDNLERNSFFITSGCKVTCHLTGKDIEGFCQSEFYRVVDWENKLGEKVMVSNNKEYWSEKTLEYYKTNGRYERFLVEEEPDSFRYCKLAEEEK